MTKSDETTWIKDFLQTFHAVNQYSIVSNGKGMLKCNIYSQSSYTSETHGVSGAHVWTLRKSTKRKSQCLTPHIRTSTFNMTHTLNFPHKTREPYLSPPLRLWSRSQFKGDRSHDSHDASLRLQGVVCMKFRANGISYISLLLLFP